MCLSVEKIALTLGLGELNTSHSTWSLTSAYQLLLIQGQGWKGRLGALKCHNELGWHLGGNGKVGLFLSGPGSDQSWTMRSSL